MSRRAVAAWALVAGMVWCLPARGEEDLDVQSWLGRAGVKLLAVELYATWCLPCMEAVPRWKALHEQYRDQGLRLVVVAVKDPEGGCKGLGWQPDKVVCDFDGSIAERLGAGSTLPAAFLWSWQGNLLVSAGHVGEVGRKVEEYLKASPRVLVEATAPGGQEDAGLRELVEGQLALRDKVTVVLPEAEREAIRALRRASHDERRDKGQQCRLGMEVSASSRLAARLRRTGGSSWLGLTLQSVEKGCVSASANVPWNAKSPALAVAEAVDALLGQLRVPVQLPAAPGAQPRAPREGTLGGKSGEWKAESAADGAASGAVVSFESRPAGALVMVDGRPLDRRTPCSKALAVGVHSVEMVLEKHHARKETLNVQGEQKVSWALDPNFGWLEVTSNPSGLDLKLDGESAGRTPLGRTEVGAGAHDVLVSDRCHYEAGERVVVEAGKARALALSPKVRPAGIRVTARDDLGNDLAGDVVVDGVLYGRAPGVFTVPLCARRVEVRHERLGVFAAELSLEERQVAEVAAFFVAERVAVPAAQPEPATGPAVSRKAGGGISRGVFHGLLWGGLAAAGLGAGLAVRGHVLRSELEEAKFSEGMGQEEAISQESSATGFLISGYTLVGLGALSMLLAAALPEEAPALSVQGHSGGPDGAMGWLVVLGGGF